MLAYPHNDVITASINGIPVAQATDTLKALTKITITGMVADEAGNKLANFNGTIYPTVYDKPTDLKTLSNDGSPAMSFSVQNSILYKGKASVTNGDFSFSFMVPKDISYKYGFGKISYYAKPQTDGNQGNSIGDASGYFSNVVIGGSGNLTDNDKTGPDAKLYLNDANFVFGGITDENPTILAFISDESGVNTIGNGIGHDITAILDDNTNQILILNDSYEADKDSYQSGVIRYKLHGLSEGTHNLRLKIWDINNNSSEVYIEFIVVKSSELLINNLFNYPNPFTTQTAFFFEHNQPGSDLDVLIQIFTVSGKLVKTIETVTNSTGFRAGPIHWDGLDDFGDRLARGVYFYRLKLKSSLGHTIEKFEKLVILK